MKASIAHGIRPTALVLGKDSKKGWNKWDTLLAKAYQRFLNELCQQCGYPKYLCHNDDNRIQFKLASDDCEATAMTERAQHEAAEAAKKSPNSQKFGERLYAEPFLSQDAIDEGLEPSDFRRPYLFDKAKRMGLIEEDAEL